MTATSRPPTAPRPPDAGADRRLPYVPALDSLRAIAVLGVLAYHHDPAGVPGGWLGVSMFFTLSGFLIAGLLLAEHESSGRIDLRAFWSRRIRRLLPASLVAIGLAFVVLVVDSAQEPASVFPDLRAAVLNIANWHFVAADSPYAGLDSAPSPVQHYWSLAIEEQFYLLFPVVAAVALRRRLLPVVVGAVIVASLGLQVLLSGDVDRAYFGTDTRAAELAAGVGLALALPGLRRLLAGRDRWVDVWGGVAVAATIALFGGATLTGDLVRSGGLTAITVVWVGLLVASVCGRAFPRLIARGPLPPLGRISYGIYLYHWPVYLVATSERMSFDGPALLAFRFAATLVLAAASSALVELPARRRSLPLRPVVSMAALSIAAVVVLTLALPADDDSGPLDVAATLDAPPVTSKVRPARPTTTTSTTSTVPRIPGQAIDHAVEPVAGVPVTAAPAAPPPPPTTAPLRAPRILVVGDSTAGVTGAALQQVGAEDGIAEVTVLHQAGCAIHQFDRARVREGYVYDSPCEDIIGDAVTAIPSLDPDAIVVFVGSAQLFDSQYPGSDQFLPFPDPAVTAAYRTAMTDAIGRLGAFGVPVLWADLPTPAWDLDAFGEMRGAPMPGSGEATSNDPARAARLNEIDSEVIGPSVHTTRWGYTAAISGPDGEIDREVRPDGLHLDPEHARRLARSEFFPALRSAYRTVAGRMAGPLAGRSPTTWSAI